ncbi:MAG: sugar phosphate isomerase/epimerase [Verrucomicrobiaceae bacterium]|nr:MAG: sugar phosphate isomerase/epimerase [Verrucomicrobiaceae bacterium]
MQENNRRQFLKSTVAAGAGFALIDPPSVAQGNLKIKKKIALGYDNFAVRAMGWKAQELIGYAAKLKCDTLFITDFGPLEKLDDQKYLTNISKLATDSGVKILLGSWSICPTAGSFKKDWGTADEHLKLGVRMAKALGSPAFRVILGNMRDRLSEGGIEARIADTVKVLKRNKTYCVDHGVKIAMENHAGDMHSTELVTLIEEAGSDFVGANMDSGNAIWTLEDPIENLRNLGKYAITTSLRDTALWESENGVTAQWTAMGEGTVDLKSYFELYSKLCPDTAVNIETISGFNRELKIKDESFWKAWPKGKPAGYDKFITLAKKGEPRKAWKAPKGVEKKKADRDYQRSEIARSIRYCKENLGLGLN